MTKRVLMLTDDPNLVDYRVTQDASALKQAGYDVILFTPSSDTQHPDDERDGYRVRFINTHWQPSAALWLQLATTRNWNAAFDRALKAYQDYCSSQSGTQAHAKQRRAILHPVLRAIRFLFRKVGLWRSWEQAILLPKEVALAQAALQHSADIVHVHDLPLLKIGCWLAQQLNARLIYDSHELYPHHVGLAPHMTQFWTERERQDLATPQIVITVNKFLAEQFRQAYGRKDVQVVHNAVPFRDLTRYRDDSRRELLEDLDLRGERTCILIHIGFLIAGRSFSAILEMLSKLPENYGVVFIGDGPARAEIEKQVSTLQLSRRVHITGMVSREDVARLSAGGDIGIAAFSNMGINEYYCSPNRLGDYVMAGLPVLASDLPFLREFAEKYTCGQVFAHDDESMAEAVKNIFENPERFEEMRSDALQAAKEFNWDVESKKLLSIYQSLV